MKNNDKKKYIIYDETTFNSDQFKVINEIFNGIPISLKSFKDNKNIIEFYDIDDKNILISELNPPYQ